MAPNDYLEIDSFYQNESNGLMLDALDFNQKSMDNSILSNEYLKSGLKKERHIFALKQGNDLKAAIIINISDVGINMSGLTNCIKLIVVDDNDLTEDIVFASIKQISNKFTLDEIPVLLYPTNYAEKHPFAYEKIYNMWILDPNFLDSYFNYVNRLLRFTNK
jgi:hypothetical protein